MCWEFGVNDLNVAYTVLLYSTSLSYFPLLTCDLIQLKG